MNFVIRADSEIAKAIKNKSHLVRQQKQIIRNGKAVITYDDNGKIIPLSQRFNKDVDDIRKSL